MFMRTQTKPWGMLGPMRKLLGIHPCSNLRCYGSDGTFIKDLGFLNRVWISDPYSLCLSTLFKYSFVFWCLNVLLYTHLELYISGFWCCISFRTFSKQHTVVGSHCSGDKLLGSVQFLLLMNHVALADVTDLVFVSVGLITSWISYFLTFVLVSLSSSRVIYIKWTLALCLSYFLK